MQKDSLGLGDPGQFFIVTAKSRVRVKVERQAEEYIGVYNKTTHPTQITFLSPEWIIIETFSKQAPNSVFTVLESSNPIG